VIHDNVGGGLSILGGAAIDPELSWSGGTITANQVDSAPGWGGGIRLDTGDGGIIEVSDVVVTANDAWEGAGVHALVDGIPPSSSITIRDSTISANSGTFGAGLTVEGFDGLPSDANVVLENLEISGNVASDSGGGLRVEGVWVEITGGAVRDDTAALGGGMFLVGEWIVGVEDVEFSGNVPDDVGFEVGGSYDAQDGAASFTCLSATTTCL
jgi:hypothetical protein